MVAISRSVLVWKQCAKLMVQNFRRSLGCVGVLRPALQDPEARRWGDHGCWGNS